MLLLSEKWGRMVWSHLGDVPLRNMATASSEWGVMPAVHIEEGEREDVHELLGMSHLANPWVQGGFMGTSQREARRRTTNVPCTRAALLVYFMYNFVFINIIFQTNINYKQHIYSLLILLSFRHIQKSRWILKQLVPIFYLKIYDYAKSHS